MSLLNDDRYQSDTPVSATTNFLVGFPMFADSDVKVVLDGVETNDFTVSATYTEGKSTNFTVILDTAVTNVKVEIYDARLERNETDLLNGVGLVETMNALLDQRTAESQNLRRDANRSLKLNITDANTGGKSAELPNLVASRYLGVNSAGTGFSMLTGPTVSSAPDFGDLAEAQAADLSSTSIEFFRTAGHTNPGDGGHALWAFAASEPSHALKVQISSRWWELVPEGGEIRVEQHGVFSSSTTDQYTLLNEVLQAAKTIADTQSYTVAGIGSTQFAKITVRFSKGVYLIGTKITLNSARVDLVGNGSVIGVSGAVSEDLTDYLIEFTGLCFDHKVEGLCFELTSVGALKWDANNSSGSRVHIEACRFVPDRFGSDTGTAIDYTNQSSSLIINNKCFFHRVKHPLVNRNCDFVHIQDNFIDSPIKSDFDDDDAMIISNNGYLRCDHCIFTNGPAWYSGKTDSNSVAIAQYNRVAYFQIGTNGTPTVTDNGRIAIENCRIGQENGDGTFVNYRVAHNANTGAELRGGIVLQNLMGSPQEDAATAANGDTACPLVRLYTAPNSIVFRNIMSDNAILGLVASAPSTDLDTLFGNYPAPTPFNESLVDMQSPNSANTFVVENVQCPVVHIALPGGTTDANKMTANKWSWLFGRFNYIFTSDAPGITDTGTTIYVNTFFTGFGTQPDLAQSFYVQGDAYIDNSPSSQQVNAPIRGWIDIQYDKVADAVWAVFKNDVDLSNNNTTAVDAQGYWNVTGTPTQTVTLANAASATLGFRLQHTGGSEAVRLRRLIIKPAAAFFESVNNGGVYQY